MGDKLKAVAGYVMAAVLALIMGYWWMRLMMVSSWLVVGSAALAGLIALVGLIRAYSVRSNEDTSLDPILPVVDKQSMQTETLLTIERDMLHAVNEPPVTTVTFFTGDISNAAAYLHARLKLVVAENPWIAGTVNKSAKSEDISLVYPSAAEVTDAMVDALILVNPEGVELDDAMPYETLVKNVTTTVAMLPGGKELGAPLLRICLVAAGNGKFAMVFSMSHVVADGYTYYVIFNNLCSSKPAVPLSVVRKESAIPKIAEATAPGFTVFSRPPLVVNMISKLFFGEKRQTYAFYIDDDKVKVLKAKAKADGAAFVSTNDILTSSFGLATKARMLTMAINMRGKLSGCENAMSGNYESLLWFDPESFGSAAAVRKTLASGPPFKSLSMPQPKGFELMNCTVDLVTSWASFADELRIDGCEQGLHLPVYDAARIPLNAAIIFRPLPGKLGMLCLCTKWGEICSTGELPIGEPISTKMFRS